ncbi:perforin-1-like [Pelmatolapia mariae]|uniref:perforin-1-like n=1 Tax=Pelmatolapia mariae TaxID=158779 RepID=UPI002FE68088
MAKLWHVLLLCWAWSPLCLPSSVSFTGTPQECEKAPFVPGYNLGGEGFDIVTMERKGAYVIDSETWDTGNGTCKMYQNSYMNGEKQKVPAAVVDWRTLPKCNLKVSSVIYESVESLVNDSTASVLNNWKADLNFPSTKPGVALAGSHAKASTFGINKSKQDRYTFFHHFANCQYYGYRLATNLQLSHEFSSAVDSLPPYNVDNVEAYNNVIDTYGTHYITQVYLGGDMKAITAVRTCKATMNDLSATEINDCLSVEALSGVKHPDNINSLITHCNLKKKKLSIPSFSGEFSERHTEVIGGSSNSTDILFQAKDPSVYKSWLSSLQSTPDVVRYSLKPLHTLLPTNHPARVGLKRGIEDYIQKNAMLKQCSETCKIGHRLNARDPCACVCNNNKNIKVNCCPAWKGLATLKVFSLYATDLYGDWWPDKTDGSVEVTYGDQIMHTGIIHGNNNPRWSDTIEFGTITIDMKNKLRFVVYDEDSYLNNDLLGECSFDLRAGNVSDSCMLNHGTFYFSYEVECAPNLGGYSCQEYIPSPMSSSLADVFYSRNGVLLGTSGEKYGESVSVRAAVDVK